MRRMLIFACKQCKLCNLFKWTEIMIKDICTDCKPAKEKNEKLVRYDDLYRIQQNRKNPKAKKMYKDLFRE